MNTDAGSEITLGHHNNSPWRRINHPGAMVNSVNCVANSAVNSVKQYKMELMADPGMMQATQRYPAKAHH
jgi:hypothetical protein